MRIPSHRLATTLMLWPLAAVLLTACNRHDDAGQAGPHLRSAASQAADAASHKTQDMAITQEINTRLTRDPQLSALSINVHTSGGQVVLRGSTPDTAVRGRAAELARGVTGVISVENDLSVQPRP